MKIKNPRPQNNAPKIWTGMRNSASKTPRLRFTKALEIASQRRPPRSPAIRPPVIAIHVQYLLRMGTMNVLASGVEIAVLGCVEEVWGSGEDLSQDERHRAEE